MDFVNESAPWVYEYISRMRLRKLGFQSDLIELDEIDEQIFLLISSEFDKIEKRELERVKARKR